MKGCLLVLSFYPRDQLKSTLFLDICMFVFFLFNLLQSPSAVPIWLRLFLFLTIAALYYVVLWKKDWLFLVASAIGIALFIILAIHIDPVLLVYLFIFSDSSGKVRLWPHLSISLFLLTSCYFIVFAVIENNPVAFLTTAFAPFLFLQLILPFVVRFIKRAHSLEKDLAAARSEIEAYVKEEERNRIARDLHDTLGHTLAVIKFKSELAIRLTEQKPEAARKEMEYVLDEARRAAKQVREVVTELKHVQIQVEIKQAFVLFEGTYISFIVRGDEDIPALTEATETMTALSIREALVNCYKHSRADQVLLHFFIKDGYLNCLIKDDGVGSDRSTRKRGDGLESIKERMRLIGGFCEWHSTKQRGTEVHLRAPLS
ncbi:sensor histidine kinase [Shouchella patagoniensis]|uniref:sensor histidine kinase n=1 Tax=Shouchella patagoniensis TaxID=228576 RepID=UPI000995AEA7|nr:sensor histidine kinase [Shouchella patagoniensis]